MTIHVIKGTVFNYEVWSTSVTVVHMYSNLYVCSTTLYNTTGQYALILYITCTVVTVESKPCSAIAMPL